MASSTEEGVPWYVHELVCARIAQGLRQKDLAKLLGSTQNMVSKHENGAYAIKVDVLADWADALGLELRLSFVRKD